jgi:hypothetical protein
MQLSKLLERLSRTVRTLQGALRRSALLLTARMLYAKTLIKRRIVWGKVGGQTGDGSDLEEFFALEELKEKRKELEQLMIFCGRPGLHGDWVRFQVEARKRRKAAEDERIQNRAELIETLIQASVWTLGAVALFGSLFGVLWILRLKGII